VNRALRISNVGLRGIVWKGLTASHVMDFAAALGTFLEAGRPVVPGRDPRLSGKMIRGEMVGSLLGCGHDLIDLGVVSAPVVQHAIQRLDAAGALRSARRTARFIGMRCGFWGRAGSI
jgi:phosphomannomutase